MLFKRHELDAIAAGRITLAFRRWRRPTVRSGGTLRTAIGVLAIEDVVEIDPATITDAEAHRAGHKDAEAVRRTLFGAAEGRFWRIELRLAADDPRVALRIDDALDPDLVAALSDRLARLDRDGAVPPWPITVLRLIDGHPGRRAADLAASLGLETLVFKRRARQLKDLGLTESLDVGYRLSPRGARLLAILTGSGR